MIFNSYSYCLQMLLGPSGAVAAACGIRTAGEHQLASLRTPIMPCLRIKIVLIISSKYVFLIQWQHVASKLLVTQKKESGTNSITDDSHHAMPSHLYLHQNILLCSQRQQPASRQQLASLRTATQGLYIQHGLKKFSRSMRHQKCWSAKEREAAVGII